MWLERHLFTAIYSNILYDLKLLIGTNGTVEGVRKNIQADCLRLGDIVQLGVELFK